MFFVIIIIIIDITIIVILFLLSSGKDDNLCRLAEFKWYHLIESLSRRSKQNVALYIYLFLISRAVSDQFTFCLRLQSVNNGDSGSQRRLWEMVKGGTVAPRSCKTRARRGSG